MTASQAQVIPTKPALRRALKVQRRDRTQQQRERVAAAVAAVGLELPRLRRADCVAVYASLFGIGRLVFGHTLAGLVMLGVAALAFAWIARSFRGDSMVAPERGVANPRAVAAD